MAHGGKRTGSGRKQKSINATTMLEAAKPLIDKTVGKRAREAVTAAVILASVDEVKLWAGHLTSESPNVALDALKYLTDRRDGKAKQYIETKDVTKSAEERARRIAELVSRGTQATTQ